MRQTDGRTDGGTDGGTDGWRDGGTDRQTDGWMNGRTDRWMGGRMNKASYRDVKMHLKIKIKLMFFDSFAIEKRHYFNKQ